jgi:hypothetical protein
MEAVSGILGWTVTSPLPEELLSLIRVEISRPNSSRLIVLFYAFPPLPFIVSLLFLSLEING